MNEQEGISEIESAQWMKDEYGYLNLYLHDAEDQPVHCWLSLRPEYCDRGHIQLNIEGDLNLDYADSFPRYFFSFAEADLHTRTFLKWRLWKKRTFPHVLLTIDIILPPRGSYPLTAEDISMPEWYRDIKAEK